MGVTKQQQIKWLAKNFDAWPSEGEVITMSTEQIGVLKGAATISSVYYIRAAEWKQERDKMQQQDNSWHERGELPPFNTVVEWDEWGHGNWVETKILADVGDGEFVMLIKDVKTIVGMPANFRPLRTEREKAIDELNALVGDIEKYPTWRDAIAGIIDAGYHK